jgi:hypothetical protein
MLGGQGHLGQLRSQTEALVLLAISTANVYSWGGLRADQINQVLNDPFNLNFPSGITRRSQAVSAPLSGDGDPRPPQQPNAPRPATYFDFYLLDYLGQTALDKWAGAQAKYTKNNNGGSPDLVAEFQLSDEPAWYLPDELTRRVYQDNPGPLLDSFRKYLSSKPLSKPLSPEDFGFGKTQDWSKVKVSLLGALGASPSTVTQRRLFYWTVRFFHTSASQGHNRVRQALIAAGFQTSLHAYVDYNNQLSKWCDVLTPNSTRGYFDFFTSARLGAHMPWSEDVGVHGGDPHDDQAAQFWSVSGDLLRSASMLMPTGTEYVPAEFGGYVHGNNLVSHPAGASQPSGPGITCNQFGKGWAIAYGFFPGVQYGCSPDRTDPQRLPLRWGKEQRDLAVAPAASKQLANTPRSVVLRRGGQDAEVVEACRLQSEAGIAVVLLNWTDEPVHDLEVTVTDVGDVRVAAFPIVSSAQGVPVSVVPGKSPITIKMPLKDVDVLLFERLK